MPPRRAEAAPRLLPALLCLLLAMLALVGVVGDLLAVGPRDRLTLWQGSRPGDVAEQAGRDLQSLGLAAALQPWDADLAADLGRLSEWAIFDGTPWSAESARWRERAIGHYRQALRLRPSWAFAWAHLAQASLMNAAPLAESLRALDRAMVLGPVEPGVQRKVLWTGFSLWSQLDARMRGRIATVLRQTLAAQAPSAIGMAVHFNRESLLDDVLTRAGDRELLRRLVAKRDRH